MTVNGLLKILNKAVADGHGRRRIHIDKASFSHPLESDGCCILPVCSAGTEHFLITGDDGFVDTLADGSERGEVGFVLRGDHTPDDFDASNKTDVRTSDPPRG